MTPEKLFGYIGEIDDRLIIKAKQKRKINKKIVLAAVSTAACAAAAVTGIIIAINGSGMEEIQVSEYESYAERGADTSFAGTGGAVSQQPHTEDSEDTEVDVISSGIYYVSEGVIKSVAVEHKATAETVFDLWKQHNNIGSEVKLIMNKVESDSSTAGSEFEGQGVAAYHTGGHFVYNVYVTKNLEAYFTEKNKELLQESLKKTMLEYIDMKIEEYNLILAE